jgi:hypothetical protein
MASHSCALERQGLKPNVFGTLNVATEVATHKDYVAEAATHKDYLEISRYLLDSADR